MGRKRTPHTSTNPGKRVKLQLRDGSQVEGKFKERTGQFVALDNGRYRGVDIEKFIVIKGVSVQAETHPSTQDSAMPFRKPKPF